MFLSKIPGEFIETLFTAKKSSFGTVLCDRMRCVKTRFGLGTPTLLNGTFNVFC